MMINKVLQTIDTDNHFKGRSNVRQLALNGADLQVILSNLNDDEATAFHRLVDDNLIQLNQAVKVDLLKILANQRDSATDMELASLRDWISTLVTNFDEDNFIRRESIDNWRESLGSAPEDIYYLRYLVESQLD